MRTTTFVLSGVLVFVIILAIFTWLPSEAEGAGGVKGGPYWNEEVYRKQQQDRQFQRNLQQQELMLSNIRMRNMRTYQSRKPATPQIKYYKIKPATPSDWNYRRANEK